MPEQPLDRSYTLRGSRHGPDEVRRAALGRAGRAADKLRNEAAHDPVGAVHEARKDMKKLRSLLRLVRDELGEARYRAENERFRDAARLLAPARDADVKLETVAGLRERYPGEVPAADGLVTALEEDRGSPQALSLAMAAEAIEAGAAATGDWTLEADGWRLFGPGLERSYRRGRKLFGEVCADPASDTVHEWRKRVKDLWYQMTLLQDAWPDVMAATAEQAHELSNLLGDHHDLSVLADDIRAGAPRGAAKLLELVERRQGELIDEAIPLGRRLYAESPKRFGARMAAYWEASRAGERTPR